MPVTTPDSPVPSKAEVPVFGRGVTTLRRMPWTWMAYGFILTLILAYAAGLRFRLPQTPLIDPDSYGYLGPALLKLTGGTFEHINGRHFLYPGFLLLVARACQDLRGISIVQHGLGLATGVVLAAAWNVLGGLLEGPKRARTVARFGGLLLAAAYLFSRSPILFESSVRPEGVFPFFLATSFLFNFGAVSLFQTGRRARWAWSCLAANFVVVAVAQALKPSLGFGAAVANLPLLFFLCRPGASWKLKAVSSGAAVAFCVLTLWLPERLLARSDPVAGTFLPETLLTIHADIYYKQITEDLRTGDIRPYDRRWLTQFDERLGRTLAASRLPENRPWPSLGFSPDYLMYVDPIFYSPFGHLEPADLTRFCTHYYQRVWRRQPRLMTKKIGTQLGLVYNFTPFVLGKKHRWHNFIKPLRPDAPSTLAKEYSHAAECARTPQWQRVLLLWPPATGYASTLETLRGQEIRVQEPPWLNSLNKVLGRFHLPLLTLMLAAALVVAVTLKRQGLPLIAGILLLWTVNFGMFLTVATIHCLGAERYVENQRVCTVFGEFAVALLLWQAGWWIYRRFRVSAIRLASGPSLLARVLKLPRLRAAAPPEPCLSPNVPTSGGVGRA